MRYKDTFFDLARRMSKFGLTPNLKRLEAIGAQPNGQSRYIAVSIMNRIMATSKNKCWPWIGQRLETNYGIIRTPPFCSVAHRLVYVLFVGNIPSQLNILHSCDNPPCCNPYHLRPGTQKDNILDCKSKGRMVTLRGSQCARAIITEQIVRSARRLRRDGVKLKDIASLFGCKPPVLSMAINRKTWKHVK